MSASAGGALGPEGFGDDAEHGSAIEQVGSVGADGQFEVAEGAACAEQGRVVGSAGRVGLGLKLHSVHASRIQRRRRAGWARPGTPEEAGARVQAGVVAREVGGMPPPGLPLRAWLGPLTGPWPKPGAVGGPR